MRPMPSMTRRLCSASGLALAAAMAAYAPLGHAQSFNGSVSATFGSVAVDISSGSTNITVASPSAVINWTPNDTAATGGPIDFQSAGTIATFTNNPSGTSNFAILNRVIPSGSTRAIQFNGAVVSQLQGANGPTPGGTVFFYSPGGILVGSNAVFDVGNLALTTSDLAFTAAGAFNSGASYVFQPAAVAGSQIVIQPGAQINAAVDGSYLAMIAPSVINAGTLTVNGSAALVAADAATIRFAANGLFDIAVNSGTSATGTVLTHAGTITGPSGAVAPGINHRIYMVAVPKNDAITMAIASGSNLGFDIAGAANQEADRIVLSAGHNVTTGFSAAAPSAGGGSGLASITGVDANITSALFATATGGFNMGSISQGGLRLAGNVVAQASGANSSLYADPGGTVTAAGNVRIASDVNRSAPVATAIPGANVTARDVLVRASGSGTISIAGSLTLSAQAVGGQATTAGSTGGFGIGGALRIDASNGGTINVAGQATFFGQGTGGGLLDGSIIANGGAGTGGIASILASGTSGSAISLGNVVLDLTGTGGTGQGCITCAPASGTGTGGTVVVNATGQNSVTIGGPSQITANGASGSVVAGASAQGTGGTIDISSNLGGTVSVGALTAIAAGASGNGASAAGGGQGGTINASSSGTGGGSLTFTGNVTLSAIGSTGLVSSLSGSAGLAKGGDIYLGARDATTLQIGNILSVNANGTNGSTASGSVAGMGGQATIDATTGGTVRVISGVTLQASAAAGSNRAPAPGSVGTGGLAQITLSSNGVVQIGASLSINANGSAGNVIGDGTAGDGVGGTARIFGRSAGSLTVAGNTTVSANGSGGGGTSTLFQGGNGTGGSASIDLGGAQASFGSGVTFNAFGVGGGGNVTVGNSSAGNGTGGNATINLLDSSLAATGLVLLNSAGSGANALRLGRAGNGVGGISQISLANSSANLGSLTLDATGNGGRGSGPLAVAGSGSGGRASILVNAGSLTVASTIRQLALGNAAPGLFGAGGVGTGGNVELVASGDSRGASLVSANRYDIRADGLGGSGDGAGQASPPVSGAPGRAGGDAQGGIVYISAAADGGTISGALLTVTAQGVGGQGGDGFASTVPGGTGGSGGAGGFSKGGTITLDSVKGSGTGTGALTLGSITLDASGLGQKGGSGGAGTIRGNGGNGSSATGGTINVNLDRGGSTISIADGFSATADGFAGAGGNCDAGCTAIAGNGLGGAISVGSGGTTQNNLMSVANAILLSAQGRSDQSFGQAGGNATGGGVSVTVHSGLTIQSSTMGLATDAFGGDSFGVGTAGTGEGGISRLNASGTGTVAVSTTLSVSSGGRGGFAFGPTNTGGSGIGGFSSLFSTGGSVVLGGDLVMDASGAGGRGNLNTASGAGGVGQGGAALLRVGGQTPLGNGGSITANGQTIIAASGTGGDAWVAGEGIGGDTLVFARQGTVDLNSVIVSSAGFGGLGTSGGTGGATTAGGVTVLAENAIEGPSRVSFNQLTADAAAFGGRGGDALSAGAAGGAGGAAQAGSIVVGGAAGNGQLQAGAVLAFADAIGGDGGAGSGASGGDGGAASAGAIQIGLVSGFDTGVVNAGSATYASIRATASGFGGNGGAGDSANPNATGGIGGAASGGGTSLLIRGAPVTITGSGSFEASATGGAGGQGPTPGLGGNATIGDSDPLQVAGAYLLVTNRFNQPTQQGSLTAADLQFTSVATGGTGLIAGTSTNLGSAVALQAINSDISAANMAFTSQAASLAAGGVAEQISLVGSTATITNALNFITSTNMSLTLDQSNLTGGQLAISGANWVLDPVAPATLGTILGTTSLSLSSGLDLAAYANVRSLGSLSLAALGRIDLGSLLATGFINVTAGSSLTLDEANSADDSVDLTAGGAIVIGNIGAATSIAVETSDAITTGNLVAGTGAPSATGPGTVALRSGGNVSTGTITASGDLGIAAVGTISTGQATAYDMLLLGGSTLTSGGLTANRVLIGDVSLAPLGQTANGYDKELVFAASPQRPLAGAITLTGPVSATEFRAATLSTFTSGAISVAPSATGSGLLRINASGALTATNLIAAKDLTLNSTTSIQTGSVTSQTGSTTFTAPTITTGAVQAGTEISLSGQTLVAADLTAATAISLDASGAISTANLLAGTGAPSATGPGTVALRSGGNVSTGTITASGDLGIAAVGTISTGQATAYDMLLLGGSTLSSGGLTANRVLIGDVSLAPLGQTANGYDKELVFAASPQRPLAGAIALTGPVSATEFRAATLSTFTNGTISVAPSATGSGLLQINASGALTTTNLTAAKDLTLSSATSIQTGSVTSQTGSTTFTAPTITTGAVQAGTAVSLTGQTITTGNLSATAQGGSVIARASQAMSAGAIASGGLISISGTDQIDVQSATSTGGLIDLAAGNVLNVGTVNGARAVTLVAGTAVATGGLVAGQGRIAAGSVQGAGLVQIAAGGQIGAGNVRSTGDNVKIASFGSTVTTGAISAARDALVSGAQGVTIGANINARDVILLSGANVSSAGILAGAVFAQSPTSPSGFTLTNATGRVLIANASMASGSLLLSTASDFSSLFVAPVSLPGSVNVTGQVAAAQFRTFSLGNMTGAGIAAFNNIEVESGGLVTVGQRWGAPNIEIASADIRIIDNGTLTGPNGPILSGLRTSATGEIDLISVSASPALIGDGLSGSGYALSAAEIGLISTHQLLIGAIDVAANPVDMLIGNLALSAGGTNGSTTIGDATGSINFITGNRQTSVAGGGIRVVGNVTGTGFASGNIVEFNTGRFEIDAGTGSVALAQGANTLGGTIEIHAANIHVASAAILDKLAADPFYVGRVAELNAPAAVQRPEGVLRALGLDLYPTGTLYIQNTGTVLDPAGFLADIDLANVNPAPNAAPASISIIVNGKWQTTAGIVSGFAARDLVVQTSDVLSFFAPESTINGCAISASSCVPETMIDPVPAIASQIQIISNNPLGSTPTLVATQEAVSQPGEASQDEPEREAQTPEEAASEADDATSPIAPPPQIIDSSPLEPQQQIEQPVAGSGNPSLIGSVVNENSAEGDAQ